MDLPYMLEEVAIAFWPLPHFPTKKLVWEGLGNSGAKHAGESQSFEPLVRGFHCRNGMKGSTMSNVCAGWEELGCRKISMGHV